MKDAQHASATFPAEFCRQLAYALNRWSSGVFQRLGTHVTVEGTTWYVQLDEPEIATFVEIHNNHNVHVDGIPPESTVTLVGYRLNESMEFRLSAADISAILYVCDKVNAGAESVHLTGDVTVVPAGHLAMAA